MTCEAAGEAIPWQSEPATTLSLRSHYLQNGMFHPVAVHGRSSREGRKCACVVTLGLRVPAPHRHQPLHEMFLYGLGLQGSASLGDLGHCVSHAELRPGFQFDVRLPHIGNRILNVVGQYVDRS
jgi:hypothetical protein